MNLYDVERVNRNVYMLYNSRYPKFTKFVKTRIINYRDGKGKGKATTETGRVRGRRWGLVINIRFPAFNVLQCAISRKLAKFLAFLKIELVSRDEYALKFIICNCMRLEKKEFSLAYANNFVQMLST